MKSKQLTIDDTAAEVIRRHGEEAFPFECCGFLYGDEKDGRFISQAVPVSNSKEGGQRRRFEISPLDYMRAEQYALQHHTQLLGVYHSHPNHPAIASGHDLAAAMPYFSYVIVSVMEGKAVELKSWKLEDEERKFGEEKIAIAFPATV
ncbi:MAG: M67 family peptidase [Saprospiraceae bacterium]|nr:MAG: M67 family peptidase [Saprospiraceae bacterium]